MDEDEMHVLGLSLYQGCYLQSRRNVLPIMGIGICYMTRVVLYAVIYSYGLIRSHKIHKLR